MALNIPLPSANAGMEEFLKQLQLGQENRFKQAHANYEGQETQRLNQMTPYEIALKKAQSNEANANVTNQPLKMDLLRAQIENAKAQAANRRANANMAGGLTKANVTKNQSIIQAISNVSPLIEELSDEKYEVPNQLYGNYLHPDKQTNYKAKTAAITDSLISAMGLPKTNESIHLATTMVERGKYESLEAYRKRLNELKKDLKNRKLRAHQSIKSGLMDDESSGETSGTADFNYDENGNLVGS